MRYLEESPVDCSGCCINESPLAVCGQPLEESLGDGRALLISDDDALWCVLAVYRGPRDMMVPFHKDTYRPSNTC